MLSIEEEDQGSICHLLQDSANYICDSVNLRKDEEARVSEKSGILMLL